MTDKKVMKLIEQFRLGRRTLHQFCVAKNVSMHVFRGHGQRLLGDGWGLLLQEKKPKSTQYQLGRNFEYRVRKYFEKNEFPVVIRSAQSKGNFDLCAIKNGSTFLIQCKRSGGIDKKECNEAYDKAMRAGAVFLLAENPTGAKLALWSICGLVGTDGWRQPFSCGTVGG